MLERMDIIQAYYKEYIQTSEPIYECTYAYIPTRMMPYGTTILKELKMINKILLLYLNLVLHIPSSLMHYTLHC